MLRLAAQGFSQNGVLHAGFGRLRESAYGTSRCFSTILCNQILDSMALLGGFSVQYYVSSSVRT